MSVRFWPDGTYEFLDPLGVAVQSGSAGTVYDDGTRPAFYEDKPGQGRQDYLANEAMYWARIPRAQIAAIRPPVPQQLFPPTEGYYGVPLTISDVFEAGDYWTPTRRSWISGPPRVIRTYDLQDEGRGSLRPAMGMANPMG